MKRPFSHPFTHHNRAKLTALTIWLIALGIYYSLLRHNNWTFADGVYHISTWLIESQSGPPLFILLYIVGPLLFFPATILTLLGGFLFGPMGILYTIIGSNSSAMVAYSIGRYFGQGVFAENDIGTIQRYAQRMRQNSFQTILIMHLIFLPFELVNYAGGFLQIDWKAFLVGTALGSIIATISIVLMGSSFGSIDELFAGDVHLNPIMLGSSIFLIGLSITLSRYIKKREGQN